MNEKTLERKMQIYKIRVTTLLEEHADVLAQAQDLHQQLQEAQDKISKLEGLLNEKNIQEERIIIDQPMGATNK